MYLTTETGLKEGTIDLLSAPLTNPLVCCHINNFRRASSGGEAMARRRKEERRARASPHGECEALGAFLLPCTATGVSLLAAWCLSGATLRGQPWTTAVTLPQGHDGLSARQMAVWWTFRARSLGRPVRRELRRNAWLDCTLVIPTTACHQRNDVETYSRYMLRHVIGVKRGDTVGIDMSANTA